jgi:predicted AAA+ superfamily ATPase
MERMVFGQLLEWKQNPRKKPLILQGARQVGKTWLMLEFGKKAYNKVAYFNFESDKELSPLFKKGFNTVELLSGFSIVSGFKIEEDCLIIFDEVQECPEAISSLKYFQEQMPKLSIIAAGSLLGIAIHQGLSFPVGKVEFLTLYPLNFNEFLKALGEEQLLELLESGNHEMVLVFQQRYKELLKQYYFVGGMPEAVLTFIETKDYQLVRKIQNVIINAYELDFSKHAPVQQIPRIRMVWQSIISQLAKENSKFIYNLLRQGARAKDFEIAIEWLKDAGLIHKVTRINNSGLPISSYAQWADFKIYLNDTGLLSAMGELSAELLLKGDELFKEFKGKLSEQFVLQQLVSANITAYYWSQENTRSEVDFVFQSGRKIIPIEVKSEENLRSKSLQVYYEKYKPEICIRTSLAAHKKQEWVLNIALYDFFNWVNSQKS